MPSSHSHGERHFATRGAWLRAGVLGANDGLLSTASLMAGVAAASASRNTLLTTGIASLVAGALSMAVGEYSSVSSQRDTEIADVARERVELEATPEAEQAELAGIYRSRGLSAALADRVAAELSATDPLVHHAREELGLDLNALAQPVQAASVSATSFAVGALVPVITALAAPTWLRIQALMVVTLVALGSLGAFGAKLGGAPVRRAAVRVLVGGVVALVITTLIGRAIGASL